MSCLFVVYADAINTYRVRLMTETLTNNMIGIFGGTFDPPHLGHIKPIEQTAIEIGMSRVTIIPCHLPPHKAQPGISNEHRLAMVKLIAQQHPLFTVDERELRKNTTSYSYETLLEYKQQHPQATLCFFLGMDSLLSFETWYRWQDILSLCHLIVLARPGYNKQDIAGLNQAITSKITTQREDLATKKCGLILTTTNNMVDVSSSDIRSKIKTQQNISALIPHCVNDYILQHKLYHP